MKLLVFTSAFFLIVYYYYVPIPFFLFWSGKKRRIKIKRHEHDGKETCSHQELQIEPHHSLKGKEGSLF